MARTSSYSPGAAGWREVLDEAVTADDVERTPHRIAEICVAANPVLTPPVDPEGLPSGQPDKATIRGAATELLRWAKNQPQRPEAGAWQILGLMHRTRFPQDVPGGGNQETSQGLADHVEAARIAADLRDPDLEILALLQLARVQRDLLLSSESVDSTVRARELLDLAGAGTFAPAASLARAVGNPPWLPGQITQRNVFRYRAHARAGTAWRMLRDYAHVISERDLAIEAARSLTVAHPSFLADALGQRAGIARALGDVKTALNLLEEQRLYAEQRTEASVHQIHLRTRYSTAQFLDDWAQARIDLIERVRLCLAPYLSPEVDPSSAEACAPPAALRAIELMRTAGRRGDLIEMGNAGYELVGNLIESGRAELDLGARIEARSWLDVAESSWRDIALNGRVAIDFRRVELDALDGTGGDSQVVGRRILELSRQWLRVPGQRQSAIAAVRHGAAGDPLILDRLTELRETAPRVDAAFLDLGIAHWHLRHGDERHASTDSESATAAFREAQARARASADGLSVERVNEPPILLNPRGYLEALQTQASAMQRLRDSGSTVGVTTVDELAVRVQSLPAVAQRLSAAVTPLQRSVIDRLYTQWLAVTADLAFRAGDHRAADAVTEVARRDLVGTVLQALANQPDMPEQIAKFARRYIATLNATVTDATSESAAAAGPAQKGTPTDKGEPAPGESPQSRSENIQEQLDTALDIVGSIIGPVAQSLFDPRMVLTATTGRALQQLLPDLRGAVLSLWLITDAGSVRLLRRLAYRPAAGADVREFLDIVEVPAWLPGLEVGQDPEVFFARVNRLTTYLLPAPLLDLLQAGDSDHPLELMIIPTGLLGVPFTALPVGMENQLLLDLAEVSIAQSLHTVLTLAGAAPVPAGGDTPLEIGIYDSNRLLHAEEEWLELKSHRPDIRNAKSLRDIDAAVADPYSRGRLGILAMAVHGTRGIDGWSQVKILPNGEHLTTGHVLQWYLPRLVVSASCNTDIRTDAGGELGGFPLAFQLRGATTIIGTLHYVEDEATAQLMGLFYAATAAGFHPAAALRQAQRAWIAADRAHRLAHTERWAYLLTYGLPH